jgi:hypothetical protein
MFGSLNREKGEQGEVEIYFEINGSGAAIDSSYWKRQLRHLSPQ